MYNQIIKPSELNVPPTFLPFILTFQHHSPSSASNSRNRVPETSSIHFSITLNYSSLLPLILSYSYLFSNFDLLPCISSSSHLLQNQPIIPDHLHITGMVMYSRRTFRYLPKSYFVNLIICVCQVHKVCVLQSLILFSIPLTPLLSLSLSLSHQYLHFLSLSLSLCLHQPPLLFFYPLRFSLHLSILPFFLTFFPLFLPHSLHVFFSVRLFVSPSSFLPLILSYSYLFSNFDLLPCISSSSHLLQNQPIIPDHLHITGMVMYSRRTFRYLPKSYFVNLIICVCQVHKVCVLQSLILFSIPLTPLLSLSLSLSHQYLHFLSLSLSLCLHQPPLLFFYPLRFSLHLSILPFFLTFFPLFLPHSLHVFFSVRLFVSPSSFLPIFFHMSHFPLCFFLFSSP